MEKGILSMSEGKQRVGISQETKQTVLALYESVEISFLLPGKKGCVSILLPDKTIMKKQKQLQKYSQQSSIIWPVWLNGWFFVVVGLNALLSLSSPFGVNLIFLLTLGFCWCSSWSRIFIPVLMAGRGSSKREISSWLLSRAGYLARGVWYLPLCAFELQSKLQAIGVWFLEGGPSGGLGPHPNLRFS